MNQPSSVHTSTTFDGDTGYRQKLIQGEAKFVDHLFPLFTSIYQKCKASIWFTYITIGFWDLQTLFTSTWPMSTYWLESNSSAGFAKIYRTLSLIFLFVDTKDYEKGLYIKELIFLIINAISFILVLTQLLYFNVHRRFINILLGPIQIFDSITLIGIIPSSFGFGKLFLKGITSNLNILEIFTVIFAFINVIYEVTYHIISLKLFSRTVSLQKTPAMSFDSSISIYIINTTSFLIIVSYIISYFNDWVYLITLVIQIAAYAYYFVYSLNMVYLVNSSNCVVSALMIACIIEDIHMIMAYISPKMPHGVPILFGIVSFNVFIIVMLIVFKIKRKKITKLLKEYDHEQFEDINSYYDSLNILKNDKRATMFLSVGFSEACHLFTDLSLFEYILLRDPSDKILTIMIQIINFFPGESRLLSRMTMLLMAKRSLNFEQRFLIYQVYKVKTLRQFSSSSDSQLKLNELRNMSRTIETITRSSLDNTNLKSSFFEALSIKAKRAHAIWREAMVDYPNNPKFCNEYCRYLVEAESNFPESLEIKNRENMIEMGKNYSYDFSFVSMVRVFPKYLFKEILDIKGNIRVKASNNRTASSDNSSNNSGSQGSGTLTSNDIDDEVLNSLGKATLSHYKSRLALHHALENKLPKPITCLIPSLLAVVVIVTVYLLFLYFFNEIKLKEQTGSMTMLDSMSKTRFYIAINDMEILLRYFVDRGNYTTYKPSIDNLNNICNVNETMVNTSKDYLAQSGPNLKNAMSYFEDLTEDITNLALADVNVTSVAGSLMMDVHPIYTCGENGYPINVVNDTISTMIAIFFVEQAYILTKVKENIGNLLVTKQFCEMISNLRYFYWLAPQVFTDFCNYQINEGNKLAKKFKIIMIIVPLCTALAAFLPIIVLHIGIIQSIKKVTEILNSFDPKVRQDAKELMSVNIEGDDIKFSDINPSSNRSSLYIFLVILIALAMVLFTTGMTIAAKRSNQDIMNMNYWDQYASLRLCMSAEMVNTMTFGMVQHANRNETKISSPEMASEVIIELLDTVLDANNKLLGGSDDFPSCIGFDSELDEENVQDGDVNYSSVDPHSIYENASISTQLRMLADYLKTTANELNGTAQLSVAPIANTIHILGYHLGPKMFKVTARLNDLADVKYKESVKILRYLLIPNFLLLLLYVLVVVSYYNIRKDTYGASLFILKRISPLQLINNKLFIKHFLINDHESKEESKTVSGNIIHSSPDCILCTNVHGVVETVNPSTTTNLGYTPEQLLGQPVTSFLIQIDEDKIVQQLDMMRNGQSSLIYEDNVTAITDSSQFLPCHITVIGMKSQQNSNLNSFVIILRNQSQLVQQQKQAEEAKAQSEKLLYQILPRDIVLQINRGESDISFMVPSSTIIFIDICKFSEYSSSLSPQEIMGNLSIYFATIDNILAKFNYLTKIKLIGDIYMAAAGLFNPEIAPEKHAEQVIQFGLEVINELEEINNVLNASLSIRIGVNTGGPIIAGVLGKDKPVFDIIGDAINVAARLQTTDDPNQIQISQATYDVINHLNFHVKQRGEVFLKGKGKQMTYLVGPITAIASTISGFQLVDVDSHDDHH